MRPTTSLALLIATAVLATGPIRLSAETNDKAFPYGLSLAKDAIIGATVPLLYGSSLYFDSVKAKPDSSAIDASAIPFFDRMYSSSRSDSMGTASDALMIATALVPAVLVPGLGGERLITVGVMYAETLGLAYTFATALKSVATRYRPYAYSASAADFADADIAASFASRHAMIAFASAVFAGRAFEEINPDSRWKPFVWAGGLGLAVATSALRVASGEHFPSDVIAGAAFGSLLGYLVPLLHETGAGKSGTSALALRPLPGGLILTLSL